MSTNERGRARTTGDTRTHQDGTTTNECARTNKRWHTHAPGQHEHERMRTHKRPGANTNDDAQACTREREREREGWGHAGMMQQTKAASGCGQRQRTNEAAREASSYTTSHPTTSWNAQPHQLTCAPLSRGCRESGGVPMQVHTTPCMPPPRHYFLMYLMYLIIIIMSLLLRIPVSYRENYGTVFTGTGTV